MSASSRNSCYYRDSEQQQQQSMLLQKTRSLSSSVTTESSSYSCSPLKRFLSPLVQFWLISFLLIQCMCAAQSLIIEKLDRKVDLKSRIVKVTIQATLFNPSGTVDAKSFYVALPREVNDHTGLIRMRYKNEYINVEHVSDLRSVPSDLKQVVPFDKSSQFVLYQVPIKVAKQSRIEYELEYFVGKVYEPLPRTIAYNARQLVVYEDHRTVLSPYLIKQQYSVFNIPKKSIVEMSVNLQADGDSGCATEEVLEQPAFTFDAKDVRIHFGLNMHLGYLPTVERQLEVSHWGSVSVKEQYTFTNLAAELDGEYDRYVVSKSMGSMIGRVRAPGAPLPEHRTCFQLESVIPRAVYDVQFFDETGNVSTSYARRESSHALLQVEPRYPVLGGWHADWRIEYKIPTQTVVAQIAKQRAYRLTVPLGPGMKRIHTDSLKVKVILPNGAHNIHVTVPREMSRPIAVGRHWGWLDLLTSRPYVELEVGRFTLPDGEILKHNLQIDYHYRPGVSDITKPLGIVAIALAPFLLFILFSRLDCRVFSKKLDNFCSNDDLVLDEVVTIAKQVIELRSSSWISLRNADTNLQIATVKVNCKAQEMPLSLRMSQIKAMSRDSYSLSSATKEIVTAFSVSINQYIEAMDEMSEDAKIAHWRVPEVLEQKVDDAKKNIDRLMNAMTGTLKKSDSLTSLPDSKKSDSKKSK